MKVFLFGLVTLFVLGILVFIFLSIYSTYHLGRDKVDIPIQIIPGVTNSNIHVSYPISKDEIVSPLVIKGEAKGTWYFEASFPVVLTNWDGLIIAQGVAQAEGDWMTENFVPFTANLTFEKPSYGKNGFLILKKDNPSDLPQNDDSIEIPVNFK